MAYSESYVHPLQDLYRSHFRNLYVFFCYSWLWNNNNNLFGPSIKKMRKEYIKRTRFLKNGEEKWIKYIKITPYPQDFKDVLDWLQDFNKGNEWNFEIEEPLEGEQSILIYPKHNA